MRKPSTTLIIGTIFIALSLILISMVWWYYNPHVIMKNSLNVTTLGEQYSVNNFNVSFKGELFSIRHQSFYMNTSLNEPMVDYILRKVQIAGRNETSIGGINGIEGIIANSSDPSLINYNIVVLWKNNNVVLITSKADTSDIKAVGEWFVGSYEL